MTEEEVRQIVLETLDEYGAAVDNTEQVETVTEIDGDNTSLPMVEWSDGAPVKYVQATIANVLSATTLTSDQKTALRNCYAILGITMYKNTMRFVPYLGTSSIASGVIYDGSAETECNEVYYNSTTTTFIGAYYDGETRTYYRTWCAMKDGSSNILDSDFYMSDGVIRQKVVFLDFSELKLYYFDGTLQPLDLSEGASAVKYTVQTLTEEQKAQARTNIGAGGGASYDENRECVILS